MELKYSDIILLPRYSNLQSRSEADTSFQLGGRTFKVPIVPANMKAVVSEKKARWLSENEYFYIMHRFGVCPVKFCKDNSDLNFRSISIGVKQKDYDDIMLLASARCNVEYVTIDIAHGDCILMKDMISYVKKWLPNSFVIAGNVATKDSVNNLASWGADCVKVGIGQGYVCTTKDKTGFTRPMFTCVMECAENSDVPIIADGGMKSNGDIAKAIVAGATLTMAGSMFSVCRDSPAASVVCDGRIYKQYFGSASEHNKGEKRHIEGVMKEVACNDMSYEEKLQEIEQDIQSSISYAGGTDLQSLKNIDWRMQV